MTSPAEELAKYLGARQVDVDGTKIVPMLCEREEAGKKVLERKGWLFELKLDGVRIIADKNGRKTSLWYRKLRGATESYGEIAEAVQTLGPERLVLDGEIVAFDEQGRPDFQRLGHRIQTGAAKRGLRSPTFVPVVYVVFDVLAVGPYDLRGFPLEARKEILSRIIPPEGAANGLVRLHPTFDNGVELFRLCQEHRLEGVVAKKLGSSYRSGERSLDWLKIKAELDAEFVVIGWTEGESDRAKLGALDLGAYEGDRLVFRGRVGSGLDASTIDMLLERLVPIEVDRPVAEGKYSPKPKRHHCLPELVVSVRYGGFSLDPSGARFLRFPVFRGVRPDVSPKDCTVAPDDGAGLVVAEDAPASASKSPTTPPSDAPASVAGEEPSPRSVRPGLRDATTWSERVPRDPRGLRDLRERVPRDPRGLRDLRERVPRDPRGLRRRIHVTAPTQAILFDGTTKDALCTYFESVAPALLRHTRERVCLLSKPDGALLWPPPKWTPKFVRTTTVRIGGSRGSAGGGTREVRGFVIDSADVLLFAIEAGSPFVQHLPFREDRPDVTDFVAIRLSTAAEEGRKDLVKVARSLHDLASEIGLPVAAKSAGLLALDVLLGIGSAPAATAAPLGTLIAHLVAQDAAVGVKVETVPAISTPFTPCAGRAGEPVVMAVPLAWDELDDVELASLGLEAVIPRATAAIRTDALDPIAGCSVDVVAVTKVLECIITTRTKGQP